MSHLPARRLITVTQEFHPHRGGIAVYAAEMAAAAARLGYAVEVWAPTVPAGTPERDYPFRLRRLPVGNSHSWLNQWRTARMLHGARAELDDAILYVPEPGPLLALQLLQLFHALPRCRLVVTLHGSEIMKLASRPIARWSLGRLLARAEHIGVVSQHTGQLLEEFFPAATARAALVPGALREEFFHDAAASGAPRSRSGKTVVLTVARLHPRKGQLRVIEALRALPDSDKAGLEYWIVGTHSKDRYETKLLAAAADAGFPVKFLGDVPDARLGAIYAQADIFAMTSVPHKMSVEGFGLVYLEAGAHGLPVVAHAIGGVPEAVAHGETGLLVPPEDRPALTAAFATLLSDPNRRQQLGEAGRARARQRSWHDNALLLFGQPGSAPPHSVA